MASPNLCSRIEEDHLTCTICYNVFIMPKALPCLHTFCEHCLRDYVVSRGFESVGQFPCPLCRVTVSIPSGGIGQFPDNHLVNSLSDTVDKTKERPTPKPRKSLQMQAKVETGEDTTRSAEAPPPYTSMNEGPPLPAQSQGPPPGYYEGICCGAQPEPVPPMLPQSAPYPHYPVKPSTTMPVQPPPNPMAGVNGKEAGTVDLNLQAVTISSMPSPNPYPGPLLYPSIPPTPQDVGSEACSQGLLLKFGKKGASVTDFSKPFGLAVSDNCDYVVTDTNGNRIFIFDYCGQPKKAFHCDCRIKDVAVNAKNEIAVVVNKSGAVLRCYDMSGRFLGEHGKFITHEESNSIAVLSNGGVVITGKQNHSVYTLTDQYKLSSKFGRKGAGDGYFQSPAFVAIDSKDHVIVSDDVNHNIQIFNSQGKFKLRFGGKGSNPGQLFQPQGVVTDKDDNIIVADSGNCRVQMFNSRGSHVRTIVGNTQQLGEGVRPINVALTPRGNVAVLLKGNYFAEVRVYNPYFSSGITGNLAPAKESSTWYLVH